MKSKNQTLAAICWTTVAILAGFMCLAQLGIMLSLSLGRLGITWVAPLALSGALIIGDQLGRKTGLAGWRRLCPTGLALGLMGFALAVSAYYFDLAWDGQWYHQPTIYAMARNWNPLTEPLRAGLSLWAHHYAKGPWYVATAIYETTGHIEWGKCTTLIAWAAMGLSVFAAGLDWGMRRLHAAAIAAVVALNPVVTSVLVTYLVEGNLTGSLMVAAAAVFSIFRRPQPVVIWVGSMAAILCINAKFTGTVFLCFIFAAGWIWCALRHRAWLFRYTGGAVLLLILGMGVFGYNPYITNTIHRHHPFYPVCGTAAFPSLAQQGKSGIENIETPKNFLSRNRLVRLAYATFGRPGNQPYRNGPKAKPDPNAQLMWPFTARPADLHSYCYHETRVAGFGPFFSGALLFGFGLSVWLLFQPKAPRLVLALVALTITGSLLISPYLWWARYGPQLWLLPVLPVVFIFQGVYPRRLAAAAWLLLALLAVNAGIVADIRLCWETKASQTLRRQLTDLRQSGQKIEINFMNFAVSGEERLKSWGIPYRKVGRKEKLAGGVELMSVVEGYPGAVKYRVFPPSEMSGSVDKNDDSASKTD